MPVDNIRQAAIDIARFGERLNLEGFSSRERLSTPFEITARVFCEDDVDFFPALGDPVSIQVFEERRPVRAFHGLLSEAVFVEADNEGSHYLLTLRPWFQHLDFNREYRIFQNKSVLDIARLIFQERGFSDFDFTKLSGSFGAREYCVQYRESDFTFLSRLFEQEGIYYYFRHENAHHKLVLGNGKGSHDAIHGYEHIRFNPNAAGGGDLYDLFATWHERLTTRGVQTVTQRSYDFARSEMTLERVARGTGTTRPKADKYEVYDYAADYALEGVGQGHADVKLAAARTPQKTYHGGGDILSLACGAKFHLDAADPARLSQEYLLIALDYRLDVEARRSGHENLTRHMSVEAIPLDIPFRPPLVTPWPVARGPETATVTGAGGEEIYVDEHGRVKVRFHWDRTGTAPEQSTCWIRVSHHSAGQGFGTVILPRVGQEVIVDFLDGNPDEPIVTGRVYNGQRTHPYTQAANKTRSVWRTKTVGASGAYEGAEKGPDISPGFNEIRMEDKGGEEEFYIHAQRNMLTDVRLDDEFKVQRDRKTRVGRDRTTNVKHNEKLTVETGNQDTEVSQGNYTLKVLQGEVLIDAKVKITLQVGDSSLVMDKDSITLKIDKTTLTMDKKKMELKSKEVTSEAQTNHSTKGMNVTSEATAQQAVKGATTETSATGMMTVKGSMVKIN